MCKLGIFFLKYWISWELYLIELVKFKINEILFIRKYLRKL